MDRSLTCMSLTDDANFTWTVTLSKHWRLLPCDWIGFFLFLLILPSCTLVMPLTIHRSHAPGISFSTTNRKCWKPSLPDGRERAQHEGESGESSVLQESCEPSSPLRNICSDATQNRASLAIVCMDHRSLHFNTTVWHGLSSTLLLLNVKSLCLCQPEWGWGEVTGDAKQS